MPFYLSIGMTADEYWYAPPILAKCYREAHKLKQRQRNEYAWLQGLYVYDAVGAVVGSALSGRGGKKMEYLNEAIDIGLETEQEKKAKIQRERDKLIANLDAFKKMWDLREQKSGETPSQL